MKEPFLPLIAAVVTAIGLVLPEDAWPQKLEATRRIGILSIGRPPAPDAASPAPTEFRRVFEETLAKRGYVVGKNLVIEARMGEYEHLPALARDLEQRKVEVIWVIGTRGGRIVREIVTQTPLVIYSCDPFEHVIKLARPGGNVTGTTCMTTELSRSGSSC